jgi:hypothetical protein
LTRRHAELLVSLPQRQKPDLQGQVNPSSVSALTGRLKRRVVLE